MSVRAWSFELGDDRVTNPSPALKELMEIVRQLAHSEENRRRKAFWVPEPGLARDHWRGRPQPPGQSHQQVPFTVEPELPMWARILGFDIKEFYTNPRVYLEATLRMAVYRFEHFRDCTVIGTEVPVWLGTVFESSLFGAKTLFAHDASPWIDREPVWKDHSRFLQADFPDFYRSGLMPVAHRFYAGIGELLDEDFQVLFPEWGRSPFGTAWHLRGHDQLLADLLQEPKFAHEMMRFLTEARQQWVQERAAFLGQPVPKGNLYNDEVNVPTLSPALVEEFVVPYEAQLSRFHGGIAYWHSCGDTTLLLSQIRQVPDIEMFHVGPWTDVEAAARAFGETACLEICLHPLRDVHEPDPGEREARLRALGEAASGTAFTVRADGLQVLTDLDDELERVAQWIQAARTVFF